MTLRVSIGIFVLGTVAAWAAWGLMLMTVEPDTAGISGEAFFLGSLFLALSGTLTLIGLAGRFKMLARLPSTHLGAAFRQGTLIALGSVGALVMQRMDILEWWSILLMVAALFILDLILAPRRRPAAA